MQVVLHCGVYTTDISPLITSLTKNTAEELPFKTQIAEPETTRVFIRKLLRNTKSGVVETNIRELLFEVANVQPGTERLFLSNAAILGTYQDFSYQGRLFPNAADYLSTLKRVFAQDELEVCFAIKNPATLLSAVLKAAPKLELPSLLGGSDPMQFRWSELISRLRKSHPDLPITVWYNEDSPLIWRSVLQRLLRLPEDSSIKSVYRPIAALLGPEHFKKFQAYLLKHPGMTMEQERRVIASFIHKFADAEVIEESIEIAGWDQETVDAITDLYEEDQNAIAAIEGINFIVP